MYVSFFLQKSIKYWTEPHLYKLSIHMFTKYVQIHDIKSGSYEPDDSGSLRLAHGQAPQAPRPRWFSPPGDVTWWHASETFGQLLL